MSGYLETYGAGVDRRLRIIKIAVLSILGALILSVILYFNFRYYSQQRRVESFLEAVRSQDLQRAYDIWGCNAQNPCRDYSFEKFKEDWGPKGEYIRFASGAVKYIEPCGDGLIFTIEKPDGEPLALWYGRNDPSLGFSPWSICPEKGVQGITLRKIRIFFSKLFSGKSQ